MPWSKWQATNVYNIYNFSQSLTAPNHLQSTAELLIELENAMPDSDCNQINMSQGKEKHIVMKNDSLHSVNF